MSDAQGFTGKKIESGPAPLTVLEAFKVVLVIIIILHAFPSVFLTHVPRQRIAGRPLRSLSHSRLVIATEEDGWRRWRRQLRALKSPLKVSRQDRLYRVCLGAACKTEIRRCSRNPNTFAFFFVLCRDRSFSPSIPLSRALFLSPSLNLPFSFKFMPKKYLV